MRVLYLTMNPNRESTTVPTEGWFRLLRDRGLEPTLISNHAGAFHAWAVEQGIPAYEVPLPFPDRRRPFRFLRSLLAVVRIGRRHKVQLVHCNEHDIYPIGQYAARLLGVPVVISVHFTLRDGYSRWAFSGRRAPARMFFVSHSSLEACKEDLQGTVPDERLRVLYNAIDLDRYHRDATARQRFRSAHRIEDAVVIGCACALRPRKQLEHLFALAEQLTVENLRVVLAGAPVAGDEAYAEALLQRARETLGDRFIYLGHQADLRDLHNGLDLFVNTSHEESFGLAVLEALACGTPVLGYPSVAVEEVVLPGGGTIVPQDDLGALVASAETLLRSPELRTTLRDRARGRAEAAFDIRKLADQLWAEYQQILDK